MRNHPVRLARAGITPERYGELRYICRQYRQMKRRVRLEHAGIVDRPEASGNAPWRQPDPTGNAAVQLAASRAARRVKVIEDCATRAAGQAVAAALLRNVSEGTDYDVLRPPIGRKQFYLCRLEFYILLDGEVN